MLEDSHHILRGDDGYGGKVERIASSIQQSTLPAGGSRPLVYRTGNEQVRATPPRSPRASTKALRWLRPKDWNEHVENLEQMASTAAFQTLRDNILELALLRPEDRVLDIGAGTGLLTLAAAPCAARVIALDISPAMCRHLQDKLERLEVGNAEVIVANATRLPLGDASLDVVISNYCFHHLADPDKRRALDEIERVLRPGGRLVFADMMFQLSVLDHRDRTVILGLVKRMVRRGPAGLVRIARNATRILTRRWEHPARAQWWQGALLAAGFLEVTVRPLDHEGGLATARKAG